ncbi:MAG TPA: hypothetical protein VGP76_14480 [Planctomycetaceae bacterium]|jgi:hypothetical protein|nr:hypothetical protein [Planctomycetaceae bacterium]
MRTLKLLPLFVVVCSFAAAASAQQAGDPIAEKLKAEYKRKEAIVKGQIAEIDRQLQVAPRNAALKKTRTKLLSQSIDPVPDLKPPFKGGDFGYLNLEKVVIIGGDGKYVKMMWENRPFLFRASDLRDSDLDVQWKDHYQKHREMGKASDGIGGAVTSYEYLGSTFRSAHANLNGVMRVVQVPGQLSTVERFPKKELKKYLTPFQKPTHPKPAKKIPLQAPTAKPKAMP